MKARWVVGLAIAIATVTCVNVSTTVNPTPPAPGWTVYSSVETGVAIALPAGWHAFNLKTERGAALERLIGVGTDRGQADAALSELERAGSPFVAVGPTPSSGAAFAYVVFTARPPEGRDAYVSTRPQAPGRTVVSFDHFAGNVGDVLHQRVRSTIAGAPATIQDQFFVERFDRLYILFVQYQETAAESFEQDAHSLGSTFTPIR